MALTIPQTQTILQSYFQTGDEPTQDQFMELIGTMFYLYNEMVNEAATAVAAIEAATTLLQQAGAVVSVNLSITTGSVIVITQQGIALNIDSTSIVFIGGANFDLTINFTTPLANAFYKPITSPIGFIPVKTANQIVLRGTLAQFEIGNFLIVIFP